MVVCLAFLVVTAIVSGQQEAEEPGASDPVRLGAFGSPTTIEIFVDFQCPSCAAIYPNYKAIAAEFPNKATIIIRHIPLTMIHDKAMIAAQAVEAARLQGKGPEMVDMILTNQHLWSSSAKTKTFCGYAGKLGLDMNKYHEDFESEEIKKRIQSDLLRARFLEITSTPTVFVNGRRLSFSEASEIEKIVSEGN